MCSITTFFHLFNSVSIDYFITQELPNNEDPPSVGYCIVSRILIFHVFIHWHHSSRRSDPVGVTYLMTRPSCPRSRSSNWTTEMVKCKFGTSEIRCEIPSRTGTRRDPQRWELSCSNMLLTPYNEVIYGTVERGESPRGGIEAAGGGRALKESFPSGTTPTNVSMASKFVP